MSAKQNLTNSNIPNLPIGSYADTNQKGLILKVTSASRTFQFYGWKGGRPVKRTIGKWPEMQLKVARLEVQAIWAEKEQPPKPKVLTLGEVATRYSKRCATIGNRTDYMSMYFERYLTKFRDTPVDEVSTLELMDLHDQMAEQNGPQVARRAILCVATLYRYHNKIAPKAKVENPAVGVDTCKPAKRNVALDEGEIVALRACLDEMAPAPRDYFLLALLTGMRRSNVAGLRRDWWRGDTIIVPAAFSKNKKELVVPLVPEAEEIVRRRFATGELYAFPGQRGGAHIQEIYSWMKELKMRMRERGVTKEFRTHDLRRTLATRLLRAGTPMPVIAALLGHIDMKSTEVYAVASTEMVRSALSSIH